MIPIEWWGSGVAYVEALERQRARRDEVLAGRGGEVLALLEHAEVVTTGRRAPEGLDLGRLAARDVDVIPTERGGLATWHGPGQLVGYLICDVGERRLGVRHTVAAIEQGLIDWLARSGVLAQRDCGRPGVWVPDGKIAAIGLHFRRGVTLHGFALNLSVAESVYAGLVPCGIEDARPASLDRVVGEAPTPFDAHESVGSDVLDALARVRS